MTGEELKAALQEIGWKQVDIARRMGLHRNTIYDWVTSEPPLWAEEYVNAMLAIKRLHDAFVKAPPIERLNSSHDDEPMENSRAAEMAARLRTGK